ncbi:MAG: hypothetical protein AAFR75_05055 [Pseudomonadota bacterium]
MPTLKHQDGEIEFDVAKAGYWVEGDKLYISATFKAKDPEAFPDRYLFAVDGYVLKNGLETGAIEISTNPEDEPPNVYVYTGFHACEVEAKLDLADLGADVLAARLSVFSEDVNYYDERAKRNEFVADIPLPESDPSSLWMPQ